MRKQVDLDTCDLLSDELVHRLVSSSKDRQINRRHSDYSIHSMCLVSWPKPNASKIKGKSAAAMQDDLQRKVQDEEV